VAPVTVTSACGSELPRQVAACPKGESRLVRPVARWRTDGDACEATIFPRPSEIVVGARDGAVVEPGFGIDVVGLQKSFERIDSLTWIVPVEQREPPFMSVAVLQAGRTIRLRNLSTAPDDAATAKVCRP
jgi:hypothetical protein